MGAGASALELPIIDEFGVKLNSFATTIENTPADLENVPSDKSDRIIHVFNEAKNALKTDVEWLGEEALQHASVDTFAKKLFLRGEQRDLRKLKRVLSSFFFWCQASNRADQRYDSFLASTLHSTTGPIGMPSNVHVITWNYDLQWEKALFAFLGSKKEVYEFVVRPDSFLNRANGAACMSEEGHFGGAEMDAILEGVDLKRAATQAVRRYHISNDSDLSIERMRFAWESEPSTHISRMRIPWSEIRDVICVGYSFPFFNREVDQCILENLRSAEVDYIYMQYPTEDEARSVSQRLAALTEWEYNFTPVPSGSKTQPQPFFIPHGVRFAAPT
jgi:hypothetical protein